MPAPHWSTSWTAGLLAGFALVTANTAPAAAADTARRPTPIPVVYDSDLDFDDASTLAYLCAEHRTGRIQLRAVTVTDNGFGLPGRNLRHARTVLDRCGLGQVPLGVGRHKPVNPAPPEFREGVESVLTEALGDRGAGPVPGVVDAARLIADTVRSTANVTVLATGPLTNMAGALRLLGPQAGRIHRLAVMGGALEVAGNLLGSTTKGFDNSQEFNLWIDPPAARAVLGASGQHGLDVRLVPLDATRKVPITAEYVRRVDAAASTPEARVVQAILHQPFITEQVRLGTMFWWDALAALSTLRDPSLTTLRPRPVRVVTSGVQAGRTQVASGAPRLTAAFGADQARFERLFLDALNRR